MDVKYYWYHQSKSGRKYYLFDKLFKKEFCYFDLRTHDGGAYTLACGFWKWAFASHY